MNSTTLSPNRDRQDILADIADLPAIVEGKLAERRDTSGKLTGHKLQRWRDGKNRTLHIPADRVQQVRQGTEGFRRMRELVDEYVVCREQEVLQPEHGSKKKPPKRSRR